MKKVIDGELVEGTPEEILSYEQGRRRLKPDTAIVDEVDNEQRLRDFQTRLPVTPAVAQRYVQQMRFLQTHIAPRPLLSASTQDIVAVRDQLIVGPGGSL